MRALFFLMVTGYATGAAASLVLGTGPLARWASTLAAVVGAAGGLGLAAGVCMGGAVFSLAAPDLLASAGGLAFSLDGLGAVFLALTSLVAAPSALYGAGYARAWDGRPMQRQAGFMLNMFLLSMSLVPLADGTLTFLLCWEGMSLSSYFLVMTEADHPEVAGAGQWYLGMTQMGLACLLGAFLLIAAGGPATFAQLRAAAALLPAGTRDLVFVLAVVGFGGKAGLIPLHVWLPRAHPAAPSHVSALMSGSMIKMGVYGLLRIGLDVLGGGPAWWGALVIGLGALSAVLGVLYALTEDDLKRLLAYSSVENVGVIALGVGAAYLFQSLQMLPAAAFALAAALFHAVNHAAFKGLLFMGAGAVLHATGTRNMNRLGGLIRGMPWTAALFLLGSVAIAGLPPLNGFVSEWLLFQALLPGIGAPSPLVAVLMVLALGMLALTAGLAAACFVKAFGITFLAIPRSPEAAAAHETAWSMRAGMIVLAAACLVLSAGSFAILPRLSAVAAPLVGLPAPGPVLRAGLTIQTPDGLAQMSPVIVGAGLGVVVLVAWLAVKGFASRRPLRVGETWGCGRVVQTPRMEYTSTAFAEPLRRIFAEFYRPTEDVSIDFHPDSRYFVHSISYRSAILPWFERYLYAPVIARTRLWSERVLALQSGSVHAYLAYLVAALVLLLGWLVATGRR
ncbi:MAG TPA: proton-conducting transporter membrane subunit [Methylomirabilota bacterium]|nr:proton-conducting transporter membrane subunit [Methylomirabilota bacterium]